MSSFVTINQNYLNAYFIDNDNHQSFLTKTDKKTNCNAQEAVSTEGKNLRIKKHRTSNS